MGRIIGFLYGLAAYVIFLGTFLYAIGFVSGLVVPKTIDTGPLVPMEEALVIDLLLLWLWRPIPTLVWQAQSAEIAWSLQALSFLGWLIVLVSTFLINHFELFGLHQVVINLAGKNVAEPHFKTPALYKLLRHPIYFGFIVAFWAAPVMTAGHLLFAAVTTAYIFVGIMLEERDLIDLFGDEYRRYRQCVSMLIPFWRRS